MRLVSFQNLASFCKDRNQRWPSQIENRTPWKYVLPHCRMALLLEMISKTKGRPKNAIVSEFKTNGLTNFVLGGEKRTERTVVNKAYRQRGLSFLSEAGLMIETMGINPDIQSDRDKGFPKGWETFMTEVGRWAERFNNTAERVKQVAAMPGSLTHKAGLLKRVRVGEKGISTEALKKRVDVFADDILKRFPKCDRYELAAAFRSTADAISLLANSQSAEEIES